MMAGDHQVNIKTITKWNIHKTRESICHRPELIFLEDSQFYTRHDNNDSLGWDSKLKHTIKRPCSLVTNCSILALPYRSRFVNPILLQSLQFWYYEGLLRRNYLSKVHG